MIMQSSWWPSDTEGVFKWIVYLSHLLSNNQGGLLPSPMSSRRKNVVILLALSMDHLFMEIYGKPRSPNASKPPPGNKGLQGLTMCSF